MLLLLNLMNSPRFGIGVDVFLFDPECRAKPIGRQFAARDQPPDLLLAQAQVRGGLFDRVEAWLFRLPAVGGGGARSSDRSYFTSESRGRLVLFPEPDLVGAIRPNPMSKATTSRAA